MLNPLQSAANCGYVVDMDLEKFVDRVNCLLSTSTVGNMNFAFTGVIVGLVGDFPAILYHAHRVITCIYKYLQLI